MCNIKKVTAVWFWRMRHVVDFGPPIQVWEREREHTIIGNKNNPVNTCKPNINNNPIFYIALFPLGPKCFQHYYYPGQWILFNTALITHGRSHGVSSIVSGGWDKASFPTPPWLRPWCTIKCNLQFQFQFGLFLHFIFQNITLCNKIWQDIRITDLHNNM